MCVCRECVYVCVRESVFSSVFLFYFYFFFLVKHTLEVKGGGRM